MRLSYSLAASFLALMSWTTSMASAAYFATPRQEGMSDAVLGWALLLGRVVELPACVLGIGWFLTARRDRVIAAVCFAVVRVALMALHRAATTGMPTSPVDTMWPMPIVGAGLVAFMYAAGSVAMAELGTRCRERFENGLGIRTRRESAT